MIRQCNQNVERTEEHHKEEAKIEERDVNRKECLLFEDRSGTKRARHGYLGREGGKTILSDVFSDIDDDTFFLCSPEDIYNRPNKQRSWKPRTNHSTEYMHSLCYRSNKAFQNQQVKTSIIPTVTRPRVGDYKNEKTQSPIIAHIMKECTSTKPFTTTTPISATSARSNIIAKLPVLLPPENEMLSLDAAHDLLERKEKVTKRYKELQSEEPFPSFKNNISVSVNLKPRPHSLVSPASNLYQLSSLRLKQACRNIRFQKQSCSRLQTTRNTENHLMRSKSNTIMKQNLAQDPSLSDKEGIESPMLLKTPQSQCEMVSFWSSCLCLDPLPPPPPRNTKYTR